MRVTNEFGNRGIVWDFTTRLEKTCFAVDISLLAHTKEDIQVKTGNLSAVTKIVALKINADISTLIKIEV